MNAHFVSRSSSMCVCAQASYFFGYMSIISYGFALMLGSIGFYSALAFVRHIYGVIKVGMHTSRPDQLVLID